MSDIKTINGEQVFPVKVSINEKYRDIVDFYTKENSLCKLINVLLDECDKNKPFKFKILKKLKNLKLAEKTNIRI